MHKTPYNLFHVFKLKISKKIVILLKEGTRNEIIVKNKIKLMVIFLTWCFKELSYQNVHVEYSELPSFLSYKRRNNGTG